MHTELAREQMVEQQIRAWDVLDPRVLEVVRAVPRERFVPEDRSFLAFADLEVPLPCGQHMLRPSVAGRLLQALDLGGSERVLEVGTGSGFVTACLARLGSQVRSLELFVELATLARRNLAALGVDNVEILAGDAMLSRDAARYDAIAFTGSLPVYDRRFEQRLEVGGRLFVIVGEKPIMDALLVRRVAEDRWTSETVFETVVDPVINARQAEEFIF